MWCCASRCTTRSPTSPYMRLIDLTIGEKTSDQQGRAVERVSAEALLPYIHQRYDDPQQIHDGPPQGSVR